MDNVYMELIAGYSYHLGILSGYTIKNIDKDEKYLISKNAIDYLNTKIKPEDKLKFKLQYLTTINIEI